MPGLLSTYSRNALVKFIKKMVQIDVCHLRTTPALAKYGNTMYLTFADSPVGRMYHWIQVRYELFAYHLWCLLRAQVWRRMEIPSMTLLLIAQLQACSTEPKWHMSDFDTTSVQHRAVERISMSYSLKMGHENVLRQSSSNLRTTTHATASAIHVDTFWHLTATPSKIFNIQMCQNVSSGNKSNFMLMVMKRVLSKRESEEGRSSDITLNRSNKREMRIPHSLAILRGLMSWAKARYATLAGLRGRLSSRAEMQSDAIVWWYWPPLIGISTYKKSQGRETCYDTSCSINLPLSNWTKIDIGMWARRRMKHKQKHNRSPHVQIVALYMPWCAWNGVVWGWSEW